MIKLFTLVETSDPDIFRVCNLEGDWKWYYIKSKNKYVPAVNHVLKYYPKTEGFYQYLLNSNKDTAEKTLEEAGEKGSRVHDAIKDLINGREVTFDSLYPNDITGKPERITTEEWKCLLGWKSFVDKYKPETIFVERTIADEDCAGTADYGCSIELTAGEKVYLNSKFKEGRLNGGITTVKATARILVIPDWKSSKGIWPEYPAQVAKYWKMINDSRFEYIAIVRVGTDHSNGIVSGAGFELRIWDKEHIQIHLKAFESALYHFNLNHPDPFEFDGSEMPDSIKVEIPNYVEKVKAKTLKPKVNTAKKAVSKKVKSEKADVTQ